MLIVAEGLEKTYESGGRPLRVLDSLDLAIERESVVAVVGPSGSGKTTLLGLMAGLDAPSGGRVLIDGQDLSALTEDGRAEFRAHRVGFVFQTFHLLPTMTAVENVMVPLELQGSFRGARARAAELLDRVGLSDRADHYPAQLSGGEQQRVALARAFANRPDILFADEPTGNLDERTGGTIIEMLEELNEEERTTLVLVTHDTALAERAHRVVTLSGGRVASDRPGWRRAHGAGGERAASSHATESDIET
ncbi:MAG: ABC transporter ATP-binding protein [Gemmatimonadota bacterium]|nr:ABC transporter ATP-binding protein [Gemmatimonadota bacterium]